MLAEEVHAQTCFDCKSSIDTPWKRRRRIRKLMCRGRVLCLSGKSAISLLELKYIPQRASLVSFSHPSLALPNLSYRTSRPTHLPLLMPFSGRSPSENGPNTHLSPLSPCPISTQQNPSAAHGSPLPPPRPAGVFSITDLSTTSPPAARPC